MTRYVVGGSDGERHLMNPAEIDECGTDGNGRVVLHESHMCPKCTEGYKERTMMDNPTHSVALTFKEWMGVASALSASENIYRAKDMDGMANKRKAIREKIAEELE